MRGSLTIDPTGRGGCSGAGPEISSGFSSGSKMVIVMYEKNENREIEIIVVNGYVVDVKTGEVVGEVFSYE
jgi:hypothetical protein